MRPCVLAARDAVYPCQCEEDSLQTCNQCDPAPTLSPAPSRPTNRIVADGSSLLTGVSGPDPHLLRICPQVMQARIAPSHGTDCILPQAPCCQPQLQPRRELVGRASFLSKELVYQHYNCQLHGQFRRLSPPRQGAKLHFQSTT